MEYTEYWTILDTPARTIKSDSIFLLIGICSGIMGFLIWKFKKKSVGGDKSVYLWGTSLFAFLGILFYFIVTYIFKDSSRSDTLKMINSAPIVEGYVSNFKRNIQSTKGGNLTTETFTVDILNFSYGDSPLEKFNSLSFTYNNVIFNGQAVRIAYYSDSTLDTDYYSILRLEIKK